MSVFRVLTKDWEALFETCYKTTVIPTGMTVNDYRVLGTSGGPVKNRFDNSQGTKYLRIHKWCFEALKPEIDTKRFYIQYRRDKNGFMINFSPSSFKYFQILAIAVKKTAGKNWEEKWRNFSLKHATNTPSLPSSPKLPTLPVTRMMPQISSHLPVTRMMPQISSDLPDSNKHSNPAVVATLPPPSFSWGEYYPKQKAFDKCSQIVNSGARPSLLLSSQDEKTHPKITKPSRSSKKNKREAELIIIDNDSDTDSDTDEEDDEDVKNFLVKLKELTSSDVNQQQAIRQTVVKPPNPVIPKINPNDYQVPTCELRAFPQKDSNPFETGSILGKRSFVLQTKEDEETNPKRTFRDPIRIIEGPTNTIIFRMDNPNDGGKVSLNLERISGKQISISWEMKLSNDILRYEGQQEFLDSHQVEVTLKGKKIIDTPSCSSDKWKQISEETDGQHWIGFSIPKVEPPKPSNIVTI